MKKDIKLLASEFEFFEIVEENKLNHKNFEDSLISAERKFESIKHSIDLSFRTIIPDLYCHSLRSHGLESLFNNVEFVFLLDVFLWNYYEGLLRRNDISNWNGFRLSSSALSLPKPN